MSAPFSGELQVREIINTDRSVPGTKDQDLRNESEHAVRCVSVCVPF